MKTYIYTAIKESPLRGCNRTITVYQVKRNRPELVAVINDINTATYKGDYTIACEAIAKEDGHKLNDDGFGLKNSKIKVWQL